MKTLFFDYNVRNFRYMNITIYFKIKINVIDYMIPIELR